MEQFIGRSLAQDRFLLRLLGLFSTLALVLAAIGIYGVMSYTVNRRAHEFGVRMAIGARTVDVTRMVLKQGLNLTLIGVAIGLAGSLALTRLIKSLLYDVSATDPTTFVITTLLLTTAALLASYIPARRAANVDPMMALRRQ